MEKSKTLATVETDRVPDYLRNSEPMGISQLQDYQAVPRLVVVQKMSSEERIDAYGVGSVVAMPDGIIVAGFNADEKRGDPFVVAPLQWWPTWSQWRDPNDAQLPMVVAESLDPQSEVATKAKNFSTRQEPYTDNPKMSWRYVEGLNFAVEIQDPPHAGVVAVASWSRGGHGEGKRLCGYIFRRGVDIYANRLTLQVESRTNRAGQTWNQLTFGSASPPFCAKKDMDRLKMLHENLSSMYHASIDADAVNSAGATVDG